jgi:hypothetical protein
VSLSFKGKAHTFSSQKVDFAPIFPVGQVQADLSVR